MNGNFIRPKACPICSGTVTRSYPTIHQNHHIVIYIYIYRVKAGGSPELPGTLSLVMYYKRLYGIEMGGVGGCNNVMWSALDWELLKPWGCSFVEAVVTATAPWEDQWCSRSKQLLEKAFVDVTMKKVWCSFRPWFSSELWHFLVVNKTTKNAWNRNSNGCDVAHMFGHPWKMYIYHFSARITVKFIRADIAIFTDRTIWEKSMKHCKTQCEINMFHIHTNKMQLASGEPPAFTLYIYIQYHISI